MGTKRMLAAGAAAIALSAGVAWRTPVEPIGRQYEVHASDRDYAEALFEKLLDRAPTTEELDRALAAIAEAPSRLVVQNELLDSTEFAERVEDDTFLFGLYHQLHGRRPLVHEMLIGRHYLTEVPRSIVTSHLLQPGSSVLDPDAELRELYDNVLLDFTDARLDAYATEASHFTETSPEALRALLLEESERLGGPAFASADTIDILPADAGGEPEYNVYYGYLHAHTDVSFDAAQNGSEGPFEAYDHARNVAGLDFMGLSDHAEFIGQFFWNNEWDLLEDAADTYNEDGTFVALRGFEYSNPVYGHICVFNTDTFISSFGALTQRQFYAWLQDQPQAYATYNHPGNYDKLLLEFRHFRYVPEVEQQMGGIELLTHNDQFSDYSVGYREGDNLGYIDEANTKGWRLASNSAQDNHSGGWGTTDSYRTGVLSLELTRAGLLEALSARRYFSTQDSNLNMSFRTDGREMGARVAGGAKTFSVRLDDPDGEGFAQIDFYSNGVLIDSRPVSGTGTFTFDAAARPDDAYYYVLVTQDDGDQAMSAPIWVQGTP